jgi:hypothetical protein
MASRQSWRAALAVASLSALALACTHPLELGEKCRTNTGGTFDGMSTPTGECQPGLVCGPSATCEYPLGEGDDCDPDRDPDNYDLLPCEEGLVCSSISRACAPLGAEGARCRRDAECLDGACHLGYVPDDPTIGECRPPSPPGGPCFWTGVDPFPVDAEQHGCEAGLVCVPPPPVIPSAEGVDPAGFCPDDGSPCGYSGTCAAPGQGADGTPCITDSTCASGTCDPIARPRGPDISGFDPFYPWAYLGPWPGICVAADALTEGAICSDVSPCAPGYECNLGFNPSRCFARWSLVDEYCGPSPDTELCGIGLRCDTRCVP